MADKKQADEEVKSKRMVPFDRIPVAMDEHEGLFLSTAAFEHGYRVAQMMMDSTMVPDHFRGNVGNCMIALNYAARTGLDPFMVMQKMYVIHGKPAIETQLQIALFNSCDKFSLLRYKLTGKEGTDERQCIAYATEKSSGDVIEGPAVSIKLAKKEGWYDKNGSKWKTLPELMLRYRAAAFFIRLYSPETTLGLMTSSEAEDIGPSLTLVPEPNSEILDVEVTPAKETEEPKTTPRDTPKEVVATEEDPY